MIDAERFNLVTPNGTLIATLGRGPNGGFLAFYDNNGKFTSVNFPGTIEDFGQANQYQQATLCGGPFGTNSTYCDTVLK